MNILNAISIPRAKDLKWYLYGEYPLDMFSLSPEKDEKYTMGSLPQRLLGLGVQIACIESIESLLRRIHLEAHSHSNPARVDDSGRIRIFCQKKMIVEGMKGACGYFVIERTRYSSNDGSKEHNYFIDFYLYEEGE